MESESYQSETGNKVNITLYQGWYLKKKTVKRKREEGILGVESVTILNCRNTTILVGIIIQGKMVWIQMKVVAVRQ